MSEIYGFEFVGRMPLIVHHNNIEGRDEVEAWIMSDEGKVLSKPGDDRTPPWTWQTYLYHLDGQVVIPADNIMSSLLFGGQRTQVIGVKAKKNYKNLSQSGLLILEEGCPILVRGKPIATKDITKLRNLKFAEQKAGVQKLGFDLYVKPVTVKKASNVRVRPRFDEWSIKGTIQIIDPIIEPAALLAILENSGRLAGLGDRRPGVEYPKKPGPFGVYDVRLWKI